MKTEGIRVGDGDTKFLPVFLLEKALIARELLVSKMLWEASDGMASSYKTSCGPDPSNNRINLADDLVSPVVEWSGSSSWFHNIFSNVFCTRNWFIPLQFWKRGSQDGIAMDRIHILRLEK